jgi:phage-related tail protein
MNAMVKAAAREVKAALQRVSDAVDITGMSDRELLDLIRQSPLPGHLVAEAQSVRSQRRADLFARKQRELAATERQIPALKRKCEEAETRMATARAEYETARRALEAARDEMTTRDRVCKHTVAILDAELELLAPESINAFIARLDAEWQATRNRGVLVVYGGSRHPADVAEDQQEASRQNNDTGARMDGLRAASAKAEELKFTALDGDELAATLATIEADMVNLAKAARAARGQS